MPELPQFVSQIAAVLHCGKRTLCSSRALVDRLVLPEDLRLLPWRTRPGCTCTSCMKNYQVQLIGSFCARQISTGIRSVDNYIRISLIGMQFLIIYVGCNQRSSPCFKKGCFPGFLGTLGVTYRWCGRSIVMLESI